MSEREKRADARMHPAIFESCATLLNLASNGVMLHGMCTDSERRVPPLVLYAQILANVCWFAYAMMRTDAYLGTTAASSGCMQLCSVYFLHRRPRLSKSTETLISLPPLRP